MLRGVLRGITDLQHPLWMCGLRPFYLFAALSAPLLLLPWVLFLGSGQIGRASCVGKMYI